MSFLLPATVTQQTATQLELEGLRNISGLANVDCSQLKDFDSTVLKGSILNKKYMWTPCDKGHAKYYMKKESCNQNIKLSEEENPDIFGNIELVSTALIPEGTTYHMDHMELHTVAAKNCITYLKRSDYKKELSRVVRPIGGHVICPFSQPLTPEACWELIKEMTSKA